MSGAPPTERDALRSLRPAAESVACSLVTVRTPALVVDEYTVGANIDTAIGLIGSAERWRAHVKTAKSERTMRMLLQRGVTRFKASTTIEAASLLRAGAPDVLYAISTLGPAQHELLRLADRYPRARIHGLLDSRAALRSWAPGPVGFFVDVDTGMKRSGVPTHRPDEGRALIEEATARGFEFRGLHHYDGHLAGLSDRDCVERTHEGLRALCEFAGNLGVRVPELVTGGSHTFMPALEFAFPAGLADRITVGPGTIVYCDLRSLERMGDLGFRPALGVLCSVLATPAENAATVDAGLTAIQLDAGAPHAAVSGHPAAVVGIPSQEHLVVRFEGDRPSIGRLLILVPLHVDTAISQFDSYLAFDENEFVGVFPVSARGHPEPIGSSAERHLPAESM